MHTDCAEHQRLDDNEGCKGGLRTLENSTGMRMFTADKTVRKITINDEHGNIWRSRLT